MRSIACGILVFLSMGLGAGAGDAPFGDGVFVPPNASQALLDASLHPIPQEVVAQYLNRVAVTHTFREFEGQNEALKAAAPGAKVLEVGVSFPVAMKAGGLFGEGFADGAYEVWLAAVRSIDATALRLCVDLASLTEDEEAWVLDPTLPRAFGPFRAVDHVEGGRWLPTIEGDTAVLMVRSPGAGCPEIRLEAVSHFYRDLPPCKSLPCNVDVSCESDATIQQVSSGVGMILVSSGVHTILGTGSLINNPATEELEPYLLTASHVIRDHTQTANSEIVWDWRSTGCDADDAPGLASLQRSNGRALLATDVSLDATLIELDSVKVGIYGRVYLGWDTRVPVVDEDIIGIHHPANSPMRISYGRVQAIDQPVSAIDFEGVQHDYVNTTRVGWDGGVTEQGSSGSCLLFADGHYRILGALTTGPVAQCDGDATTNFDFYSSFRDFYGQISPAYLNVAGSADYTHTPAAEPPPPPGCIGGHIGGLPGQGPGGPGCDLVVLGVMVTFLFCFTAMTASRKGAVTK